MDMETTILDFQTGNIFRKYESYMNSKITAGDF